MREASTVIDTATTTIPMRNVKEPFLRALTRQESGGERDRTVDLLRAKQMLSQLSYAPK